MSEPAPRRPPPEADLLAELARLEACLTVRQRAFCRAYTGRAGRAAATAGYRWPDRQGSRLKTMPRVAAVLALRLELGQERRRLEREARWQAETEAALREASDPSRRPRRRRRRVRGASA